MVHIAVKNYSVLKVFRNAISFPLCMVMKILWNRYCVSRGSRVTCVMLPRSATSYAASLFHGPPVSMANGTKWCVAVRQAYFVDLLIYYYYYCYYYYYYYHNYLVPSVVNIPGVKN